MQSFAELQITEQAPVTLPRLPPELWEIVFEFIAVSDEDQVDLHACSAVSRSWNDFARRHIFRLVLVRFGQSARTLRDLIDTKPQIASAVEELAICAPDPEGETPLPVSGPEVHNTVKLFLNTFPRLKTMMMMGMYDQGQFACPELFRDLGTFTTVERFEILGCKFSVSLLHAYICSFPNIHSLSVNTLAACEEDLLKHPPSLPVPKLKRIRLRTVEAPEELLPWIASWDTKHLLQSANLDAYDWEEGIVEDFLKGVGDTLVDLDLKLVNTGVSGLRCAYFRFLAYHDRFDLPMLLVICI